MSTFFSALGTLKLSNKSSALYHYLKCQFASKASRSCSVTINVASVSLDDSSLENVDTNSRNDRGKLTENKDLLAKSHCFNQELDVVKEQITKFNKASISAAFHH